MHYLQLWNWATLPMPPLRKHNFTLSVASPGTVRAQGAHTAEGFWSALRRQVTLSLAYKRFALENLLFATRSPHKDGVLCLLLGLCGGFGSGGEATCLHGNAGPWAPNIYWPLTSTQPPLEWDCVPRFCWFQKNSILRGSGKKISGLLHFHFEI